jgi:hypothetical protein
LNFDTSFLSPDRSLAIRFFPAVAGLIQFLDAFRRLYPKVGRSLHIEGRTQAAIRWRATKLRLRVEPGIRPNSPRPRAGRRAQRQEN